MVDDPYPDDKDPDAWQKFFSQVRSHDFYPSPRYDLTPTVPQFGHVTFITIAFNNGDLLKVCDDVIRTATTNLLIACAVQRPCQ